MLGKSAKLADTSRPTSTSRIWRMLQFLFRLLRRDFESYDNQIPGQDKESHTLTDEKSYVL